MEKIMQTAIKWNIFVRELENILQQHGMRLGQLDDRLCIHREKVRRMQRSLREPGSVPVLNPEELNAVVVTLKLSQQDEQRLQAALLAAWVEQLFLNRGLPGKTALSCAEKLLPVFLLGWSCYRPPDPHPANSGKVSYHRPQWNLFARTLDTILQQRGHDIADIKQIVHPAKAQRLKRSLEHPLFPTLQPQEMCNVALHFHLQEAEYIQLWIALVATTIEEKLMGRLPAQEAFQVAEYFFVILQHMPLCELKPRCRTALFGQDASTISFSLRSASCQHPSDLHKKMVRIWSKEACVDPCFTTWLRNFFLTTKPSTNTTCAHPEATTQEARGTDAIDPRALHETLIQAWLQEKERRTHSQKTMLAYRETIFQFSQFLQQGGEDLFSEPPMIAQMAAQWALQRCSEHEHLGPVRPSTYRQRLRILSSFYRFLCTYQGGCYPCNPILLLGPLQTAVQSVPQHLCPTAEEVAKLLADLPSSTGEDLRDGVILWIALMTGRQPFELARLRWQHVRRDQEQLSICWPHRNSPRLRGPITALPAEVASRLLTYLRSVYHCDPSQLAPESPLWVSFSTRNRQQGISAQTIAKMGRRRLGRALVHPSRQRPVVSRVR
jgi:site-specific recombinase XerD